MERKTKHRLLGIFVVIGLVIIILPFFQGEKENAPNTALVTAPPFPDQPVQVATNANEQNQTKMVEQQAGAPQAIINNNPPPQTSADNTKDIKEQPDDTISVIHPSVIKSTENPVIETPAAETNVKPEMTKTVADVKSTPDSILTTKKVMTASTKTKGFKIIEDQKNTLVNKKSIQAAKKHLSPAKVHLATSTPVQPSLDDDGLMKLKSSAWVIQVGSYKNKENALRIVNHLRANGYRAFIQQVTTALGEHTRVFIGPENKRTAALALAGRLHSEMHLQGIVISYKPLTL